MLKSLAGVEPYLHGVGVAVNKDMLCWDDETDKRKKVFITVWDGMQFCNTGDCYSHACSPAEEDENSFVRDGVRYVNVPYTTCAECDYDKLCGFCDGCKTGTMLKRAEKQMRAMTAKEIYELAHQGAAFARFYDGHFKQLDFAKNAAYRPAWHRYCLLSEMTDDKPSTWAWRELKTECE